MISDDVKRVFGDAQCPDDPPCDECLERQLDAPATPPVSLPDALREKLIEWAEAFAGGTTAQIATARASLEAALAPYLADAARYQFLLDALDITLEDRGEEGYWIAAADDIEANHFIGKRPGGAPRDLTEAIDAASRAVPPAPPEARR